MQFGTTTIHAATAATRVTLAAIVVAALAACGGGGGAGAGADAGGAALATAGDAGGGGNATASAPAGATVTTASTAAPVARAAALARSDFQVNTTVAGDQDGAVVARLAGGGFVAVWTSGAASAGRDVRLQRYDTQARPLGAETLVAAGGFAPGVTALPAGGFLVTWTASPFTYEANGFAQAFDAQGQTAGARIALAATFYKFVARPTALADGSIVVAADTVAGKYGAGYGLLTRYALDGTVLGPPVRLDSDLDPPTGAVDTNVVADVTAAPLPGGGFLAAWIAAGRAQAQLRVARFDAQGVQQGAFATLAADAVVRAPSLATLADGSTVVAWEAGAAAGPRTAYADVLAPDGSSRGRRVLATDATASALQPRVAATADGGFVAAWRVAHETGTALERQVLAQRFTATGAAAAGAEAIGSVRVPLDATATFTDSLAVAGAAGAGHLVLHGGWSADTGWEVLGAAR